MSLGNFSCRWVLKEIGRKINRGRGSNKRGPTKCFSEGKLRPMRTRTTSANGRIRPGGSIRMGSSKATMIFKGILMSEDVT